MLRFLWRTRPPGLTGNVQLYLTGGRPAGRIRHRMGARLGGKSSRVKQGGPNRRRHRGRTLPGTRARFAALCYMATQPMTTAPAPTPAVIHTMLADGQPVCLRRITPADGALMRAGIEQMSPQSRYLRFFSGMRTPPDWLVERLLDVDGDQHLAWGAIASGAPAGAHPPCNTPRCEGPAIGAVHAFRTPDDPDCAEFSVAVLDAWHHKGLGRLLTATLLLEARAEGIAAFHVDTLSENRTAIAFTQALGGTPTKGDGLTRSFTLDVEEALRRLREECEPEGLRAVFAAF